MQSRFIVSEKAKQFDNCFEIPWVSRLILIILIVERHMIKDRRTYSVVIFGFCSEREGESRARLNFCRAHILRSDHKERSPTYKERLAKLSRD